MGSLCFNGAELRRVPLYPSFKVAGGIEYRAHPVQVRALGPGTSPPSTAGNGVSVDSGPIRYFRSVEQSPRDEALFNEGVSEGEGNWVMKILHVRSIWSKRRKRKSELQAEEKEVEETQVRKDPGHCSCCNGSETEVCRIEEEEGGEQEEFDKDSFSRLLRKVSLAEAGLYARMAFLGTIAYSIHRIKPGNLLKNHGLRFVTSSLEKKAQFSNFSTEKKPESTDSAKDQSLSQIQNDEPERDEKGGGSSEIEKQRKMGQRISASAAHQIAAAAASYVQSQARNILPFKSSKPAAVKGTEEESDVASPQERSETKSSEVASFRVATNSVTAVVAAEEEMKQAVAEDLNSGPSSPCEWFACDDDSSGTRFFAIQGSGSLAAWQANLLFEPIQFEELDVFVHRGIYEVAKGMYEQMLPEIRSHLKSLGNSATFRFTGHSLGGSLALLVNLMLLKRGEVSRPCLLPVVTFGSPSILCGGDRLLRLLDLPRSHLQSVTMHRDIVPRAFSCNYPDHVVEILKAVNANLRNHPCLNHSKLLYAPMGELLILQPEEQISPNHHLLPPGSGLYFLSDLTSNSTESSSQLRAAQTLFLNSPHPLEILSDPSAYRSDGAIYRDHDMNYYLRSIRNVVRQEVSRVRKLRREQRRKLWHPLVAPQGVEAAINLGSSPESSSLQQQQQRGLSYSGLFESGKESLRRLSRFVASQHLQLLALLLLPARLLVVRAWTIIRFF